MAIFVFPGCQRLFGTLAPAQLRLSDINLAAEDGVINRAISLNVTPCQIWLPLLGRVVSAYSDA
jgi:hypothetical protein